MKKVIQEFKDFAVKGNVVDMAVGIIIGGAFGTIVKSIVDDIIMPPLGMLLGNIDFKNMLWVLKEGATPAPYASLVDAKAAGAVTVNYGVFINNIVSFAIVAFAVFMLIKGINSLKKQQAATPPPPPPSTKECPFCFSDVSLKATKCAFCTSALN